jgi:hypothetical protein
MNDALGNIYIYNAKAEGLNYTFEANAYFKNGTVFKLEDAYYSSYND